MSRAHYWQYIQNSEGQPINGANINVYEAGGTTAVYVYDEESAGNVTNTLPQTTSNVNGFFEFWISDGEGGDSYGYADNIKFKITWDLDGVITPGSIDNVDIGIPLSKAGKRTVIVSVANLVPDGQGLYYYKVEHNLNNLYPSVTAYQLSGGSTHTVAVTAAINDVNNSTIMVIDELETIVTLIG